MHQVSIFTSLMSEVKFFSTNFITVNLRYNPLDGNLSQLELEFHVQRNDGETSIDSVVGSEKLVWLCSS